MLKNTENIENEIKNNSTNMERINKLGCTEGIKKTKLKKRPPGYEMVQKKAFGTISNQMVQNYLPN